MPIRNDSDLARIKADIGKCRLRIEQMTAGKVGVVSAESHHVNAGQAFENQLKAQHSTLARLEAEFVNAMIAEHQWSPAQIIAAMGATFQAPAAPVKDGVDTPGYGGRPAAAPAPEPPKPEPPPEAPEAASEPVPEEPPKRRWPFGL